MYFDGVAFWWSHGHLDYFLPDLLTFFEKRIPVWVPFQVDPGSEGEGAATSGCIFGPLGQATPTSLLHDKSMPGFQTGALEKFRTLGAGVGIPGI